MSKRRDEFDGETDLDFLFKVLSIHHPLSLQIHPDKTWARLLHAKNPEVYKTPKHKPEMAIACTPFTALCGFRPKEEINGFIKTINEINDSVEKLLGVTKLENEDDLQLAFVNIVTMRQNDVTSLVRSLLDNDRTPLKPLMIHLHNHLAYDRGCLLIYLLNYIKLQPGEAIYLEALTPHAYISGNCIECMALSDNVIRAGLTFKFIDLQPLIESTRYKFSSETDFKIEPKIMGKHKKMYLPPNDNEFAVCSIRLPQNATDTILSYGKPQILLVVEGEIRLTYLKHRQPYSTGAVILLKPNCESFLTSLSDESLVYIAY